MNAAEIKSEFIGKWLESARADDGAWLRAQLGSTSLSLEDLVDGMRRALECIPVEDPDPDDPRWDPNFVLKWQEYGAPAGLLTRIELRGDREIVLRGEYDAFESFGLDHLVQQFDFERVVIVMPDGAELDEIVDAAGFFEDALGLEPQFDSDLALMWEGDATRLEAKLDGSYLER